jgi:hypothetical protein
MFFTLVILADTQPAALVEIARVAIRVQASVRASGSPSPAVLVCAHVRDA